MNTLFRLFLLVIAIIALSYVFFYFADVLLAPSSDFGLQPEVCYQDKCFAVELAQTEDEITRGLMYREKLDEGSGMLFIFSREAVYPFWMKNTLIPLDIIWMDKDGKIVHISRDSKPCGQSDCLQINPGAAAKYVLEINGGISSQIGLNEGDSLKLNIE